MKTKLLTKMLLVAVGLFVGASSAWADEAVISWNMGEDGAAATSANSITGASGCAAEGFTIAITGNAGKNWSNGNGSITYSATSYTTLKNSNGAQNTITCPTGKVATQVVFYATSNCEAKDGNSVLTEIDGTVCSDVVSTNKNYTSPTVITKSISNKNSFTFTFSTKQVCFLAVVTYTDAASDVVADPQFSQTGNNVTLTCGTTGAKIYYTTDGSEPTTSSTLYSSAITLDNSCTIRAKAFNGPSNKYSSDIVKRECYANHSSVSKYLTSLGYNGGTVSGDVWTGANFTITNNVENRGINYVNLAGSQDGFKLNHTDSYTIQPSEGIKVTKLVVVGKTWLTGSAGNASTIAFDDWTPASGTFFDYPTDGETYVKTIEFTPSTEQTYGQAITMRPGTNQVGAYIEVYGDIKTYTISYDKGTYGSGTIDAGVKTYGTDFTLSSSTFTRAGYIQTGWATSDGGVQLYTLGGTYTANADVTLYPVWAEVSSITAFNYTDGKTISQLEALGWTFHSATANPTSTGEYVNLVSAFNSSSAETITALTEAGNKVRDFDGNALAFAKNPSAYAMYDLGAAYTVVSMSATLYGGSSSGFDQIIEYLGADGTTVKRSYTNNLNAGNWQANSISKNDEIAGVRYIKVYGATKWIVMYNLSVTYKESLSVGTKSGRNYASYVTPQKLDFSAADGITAYIATGLNGSSDAVVLKSVDIVPAGEPIIVKTDTKGATVNVPVTTADASDVSGNNLVAGDGTTAWNGTAGYTYYYLASDQFHEATSGTLQSGKAYLKVGGSGARQLSIVFGDDEVTGISDATRLNDNEKMINDNFYDLQGRKVAQPTKGLYIVNGRKVIIK